MRNLQSFRTGQDVVFMFPFLKLEYNEVVQSCKNSISSKFYIVMGSGVEEMGRGGRSPLAMT